MDLPWLGVQGDKDIALSHLGQQKLHTCRRNYEWSKFGPQRVVLVCIVRRRMLVYGPTFAPYSVSLVRRLGESSNCL